MKNISENFLDLINGDVYKTFFAYEFTLNTGEILRICDGDIDLIIEGKTFVSTSFADSADSLKAVIDEGEFSANLKDIVGARYKKYLIDMESLAIVSILKTGRVNQFKIEENIVQISLGNLVDGFSFIKTEVFSEKCRAEFCDSRCGLNQNDYKYSGTVSEILGVNIFGSDDIEAGVNFGFGVLEFTSGSSVGAKFDIREFKNGVFETITEISGKIEVGDSFEAVVGCDKYFKTCIKFNNAENFRGEPHIPGNKILFGK